MIMCLRLDLEMQCCYSVQCNSFEYRDLRALLSSSDFYSLFLSAEVMLTLEHWCLLHISVLSGPLI